MRGGVSGVSQSQKFSVRVCRRKQIRNYLQRSWPPICVPCHDRFTLYRPTTHQIPTRMSWLSFEELKKLQKSGQMLSFFPRVSPSSTFLIFSWLWIYIHAYVVGRESPIWKVSTGWRDGSEHSHALLPPHCKIIISLLLSLHLKTNYGWWWWKKWQTCRRTRLSLFIASHTSIGGGGGGYLHYSFCAEKILIEILHGFGRRRR